MNPSPQSNENWASPGRLVKVSKSGYATYVECAVDGSLTERGVTNWGKVWAGKWRWTGQDLVLAIGDYELHVPDGSVRGREFQTQQPWAAPTDFYVFRAVPKRALTQNTDTHRALLKFTDGGVQAAELLSGGLVREYNLLAGWRSESWGGDWSVTEDHLEVGIGPYHWREELADGLGYFMGVESNDSAAPTRFPAVCAAVDPSKTENPLGFMTEGGRLFEANGYEFFSVKGEPKGYFASVLEARKPSMIGGFQRLAAKCVRPGDEGHRAALREIELAQAFSATDGLIAAFEYFQLPDDRTTFGEFAGGVVQILELGETDLQRHLDARGRMSSAEILDLSRSMASALFALHTKFGFVHSDVRPANVIGRRTGEVLSWRLADFNVTTRMYPDSTRAPLVGLTESSASPTLHERLQAGGDWTEAADDIWALGLLLAQCDAGFFLVQRVTEKQAAELVARSSPTIRPLLQGCLDPSPSHRWTAEKLLTETLSLVAPARAEAATVPFRLEPTKVL